MTLHSRINKNPDGSPDGTITIVESTSVPGVWARLHEITEQIPAVRQFWSSLGSNLNEVDRQLEQQGGDAG